MQKTISKKVLENIEQIIFENEDVVGCDIVHNGKVLVIKSLLNPEIIDQNFQELDLRLQKLENKVL
jgi:hypothetical protein